MNFAIPRIFNHVLSVEVSGDGKYRRGLVYIMVTQSSMLAAASPLIVEPMLNANYLGPALATA